MLTHGDVPAAGRLADLVQRGDAVRAKLAAQGLTPRGSSPEELGTATRAQLARYGALIKQNNITAD